jgi:hypothetical protein
MFCGAAHRTASLRIERRGGRQRSATSTATFCRRTIYSARSGGVRRGQHQYYRVLLLLRHRSAVSMARDINGVKQWANNCV